MRRKFGKALMTIGATISLGLTINDLYHIINAGLPFQIWIAIGLSLFFVGVWVLVTDKEVKTADTAPSSPNGLQVHPKGKLTMNHRIVIMNLLSRMYEGHGHDDPNGIEADYTKGIDTEDILNRACTICGKPRNQRGMNK